MYKIGQELLPDFVIKSVICSKSGILSYVVDKVDKKWYNKTILVCFYRFSVIIDFIFDLTILLFIRSIK